MGGSAVAAKIRIARAGSKRDEGMMGVVAPIQMKLESNVAKARYV